MVYEFEYVWFVLETKNCDMNAAHGLFMNVICQPYRVQLNIVSKPIKGRIWIIVIYSLLWDITVRVLQLQSGDCKFHWLEHWGAIETKAKRKKILLCKKIKPAHKSESTEHPQWVCCLRIIFLTSKELWLLSACPCSWLLACFWQMPVAPAGGSYNLMKTFTMLMHPWEASNVHYFVESVSAVCWQLCYNLLRQFMVL